MKANDRNRPETTPDKPFGAPLSRAAAEKIFGDSMQRLINLGRRRRVHPRYDGPTPKLDGHDADRIEAAKAKRARRDQRRLNEFHR